MMNRNILHPMMFETPTPQTWWIYWNSQLWLISLSSDNETWITLADKNLGATKVSDWSRDSIWEWAGWHYYQWWNNHWFPFSWTFQTSSDKVDATNYGPYYYSDIFIIPSQYWNDWTTPSNSNLWGGVTWTNESKRGPCPEWYHIPSKDENSALVSTMQNLWYIGSWDDYKRYLFMPYAGARESHNQWEPGSVNTSWEYWSVNSTVNSYEAHAFYISDSTVDTTGQWTKKTEWCSIRPFKNIALVPDDTWRVLHQWSGSAWIFWNGNEWVISLSSDGINRISIADKNLWATAVYSYWDELTEANCWKYFQRWNNYGFSFSWELNISSTQVNATNYWPYYNSDIYITWNNDENWSSSNNNNLWWWITDTLEARRWPCEEWFHIPLHLDFQAAIEVMANLGIDTSTWACMINYLKLPPAWYRNWNGELMLPSSPMSWSYRTSSTYDNDAWYLFFEWPYSVSIWTHAKVFWLCIRPFKNTPVVPDSTRTKLL